MKEVSTMLAPSPSRPRAGVPPRSVGGWLGAAATLGLLVAVLVGCGQGPGPGASVASPVSETEARAMAENMLAAYNAGDYGAWARDWSDAMKAAIPEAAFQAFRDQTMAQAGMFESIESITVRPGQNPGVTRWESTVRFEKGRYVFTIAFNAGSKLIEGVDLRAAP